MRQPITSNSIWISCYATTIGSGGSLITWDNLLPVVLYGSAGMLIGSGGSLIIWDNLLPVVLYGWVVAPQQ